ncbi:DUF2793 domain-containing protein [Mangrovicella endophytica]|uniref:DUF2793 domain-containing protein n=1 Tax=Mangrovicella endophytica TaxID=2066697 RepID=UPI000C9E9071|nr:DUF2793 domain-containing protein [Mangrovicella endophytica]
MDTTPHLALPYLFPAQAQKHLTVNEALQRLDAAVQLSVVTRSLASPPAEPPDGGRYIVAAGATDDWAGQAQHIAAWQEGAWTFLRPALGWRSFVADEGAFLRFDGAEWVAETSLNPAPLVGVNTLADEHNRLAVKSEAVLFDHQGGSHRLKLNKAAAADTASLLFQTGYGGRAEIGTAASDDLRVKVSPDGAAWKDALVVDRLSGAVRLPAGLQHAATAKPVAGLIFTPGGDGQISIYRNDVARSPSPRQAVLASRAGDLLTMTTNAAPLFFSTIMRNVSMVRVWNVSKSPEQPAWIKSNPATNQLQVHNAADVAGWAAGETIQIGDPVAYAPAGGFALDISPMLTARLGTAFRQAGLVVKIGSAGTALVSLSLSPTAEAGSFALTNSLESGALNNGIVTMPCTNASPVSDSNLIFVREGGPAGALGTTLVSVIGVLA